MVELSSSPKRGSPASSLGAKVHVKSGDRHLFFACDTCPQESPYLLDRSKNVGEERLLLQHLGEAPHQCGFQ
jgi:hypothetical protein